MIRFAETLGKKTECRQQKKIIEENHTFLLLTSQRLLIEQPITFGINTDLIFLMQMMLAFSYDRLVEPAAEERADSPDSCG